MIGTHGRSTLERLQDMSVPEPNTGCLLWTGSLDGKGYGQIMMSPANRPARAHRVMYQEAKGPVPNGLDLDHLCRVRSCINPDHLEPVSRRENLRRSPILNFGRDHCAHGHLYTPETTRIEPDPDYVKRHCRVCDRLSAKRQRQRHVGSAG